jgi:hypothetical protein
LALLALEIGMASKVLAPEVLAARVGAAACPPTTLEPTWGVDGHTAEVYPGLVGDQTISVTLSVDDDGFLRRECPHCEREFKWLPGDRDTAMPAEGYACPYCARRADPGAWWTKPQLEVVEARVMGDVLRPEIDQLEESLKDIGRSSGGLVEVTVTRDIPNPPSEPLTEPNDMRRVDFPCHPAEPVKVSENWSAPVHCLICATPTA